MIRRRYGFIRLLTNFLPLLLGVLLAGSFSVAFADQGQNQEAVQGYPYEGMVSIKAGKSYKALTDDLKAAIKKNKMGLVTRATASGGAAAQGITIPGNMVVGVYRNDFARRMLAASVPAGIEAPIRFYVTENADGTANLTYRKPSAVFAPYKSVELDAMALELDGIFEKIAIDAAQ